MAWNRRAFPRPAPAVGRGVNCMALLRLARGRTVPFFGTRRSCPYPSDRELRSRYAPSSDRASNTDAAGSAMPSIAVSQMPSQAAFWK